jgi:glycosyltransferase involved in cell wall biosynthesis
VVLTDKFRAQAVEALTMDPNRVTRIRGGVDVEKYRPYDPPAGIREQFGLSEQDVVFGIVARVQWHRRFDVLLDAFDRVRQRDPGIKIVVLGRGTHKEEILDRPLVQMGLEETVYPLGYRREDYRDVLAMLDAGLMLVPGSDASCRAAMEMASMGKPLVVAERGVLPDIVVDGRTGIAVKDSPENLATAVLEMAHDPEKRRRWGEAARERMVDLFSLDRQADATEQLYHRLLSRRGTRA